MTGGDQRLRVVFFFSSRRRHTRCSRDWSSDVCSSDLGLTREAIERALLTHGTRVLEKELGLVPRVFRLVCIPSDVHFRLGEAEGWGRKPFWTHFDGYLIRTDDGRIRLQALAGGDVRYGGLYDLVRGGRDYASDPLVPRFALVHRE